MFPRFSALYQGWEACAAVSSTPIEAHTLQLSDSEELDAANSRDTENSPPQSHAYEELLEVVTRAVERNYVLICQQKGKMFVQKNVPHFALDPLTYRCILSLSPAADFTEPRPPRHNSTQASHYSSI